MATMKIQDALSEYLLQLDANGRAESTRSLYERHVKGLIAWLAPEDEIEKITPATLARFLASPAARDTLNGRERKPASVNSLRGALRGFFRFLHDAEYLRSNPARLIRRARCGAPPPRFLTAEEQAQLLKTLRRDDGAMGRDYALVHLLLATGLRIGSALGLRVEDIDCARGEAAVRYAKGNRPTVVVLSREIAEHLGWFIGDRTRGPLFEITARHARRQVRHWCERAGIRTAASCHTMRHSFATSLLRKTGNVLLVQRAMHHESVGSTLRYIHVNTDNLRAALN